VDLGGYRWIWALGAGECPNAGRRSRQRHLSFSAQAEPWHYSGSRGFEALRRESGTTVRPWKKSLAVDERGAGESQSDARHMDRLREEILNSQAVRSDLLKYKLVIAGALGAAGLGLAGANAAGHSDLVLCAVPLACLYVDLLCRHLSLRILVIGMFFRAQAGSAADTNDEVKELAAYEDFVEEARDLGRRVSFLWKSDVFGLEDAAVTWSTVALSLGVLVYGIVVWIPPPEHQAQFAIPFVLSGAIGLGGSLVANLVYRDKSKRMRKRGSPN